MSDVILSESLRIDAYASCKDIKRLKALRDDYVFWSNAVPEYKDNWIATIGYCEEKITELDTRYVSILSQ